jgi:hypothetical protein
VTSWYLVSGWPRRVVTAATLAASLAVVLTVVWLVPVSTAADAGSYEATADATIAAVAAALLVVVPAVVAVATQALSQFSWRTVRVVAGWQMAAWMGIAAVLGVCVPLVLTVNPSAFTTRLAFTCLVISIVIVGGTTWNGARRATPDWLVHHVARRVLRPPGVRPGRRRDLARQVAVLGDLVGSSRLPVGDHRIAAISWCVALADQVIAGVDADDVAQSVREVGADLGRETAPVHRSAIVALAALGMRLSWSRTVGDAVTDMLFDLAVQDRAAGHHQIAAEALDRVADVAVARLVGVIAPQNVLMVVELPPPLPDPAPVRASPLLSLLGEQALRPKIVPSPVLPDPDQSAYDRVCALARQALRVDDVGRLLEARDRDGVNASFPNMDASSGFDTGYELLESTVDRLIAVLASPRPASTGWSGGHHEAGSFGSDIERLGRIGQSLYTQYRYSTCDAIETHLETVGATLIGADAGPSIPTDRTGWRVAHLSRRPSPAQLIAEALRDLAISAFDNGYDRRALLTGRRLLGLATAAATAGDQVALNVYADALYLFVNRTTYHTDSPVVAARGAAVIAGLIRESDDLRRALPAPPWETDSPASHLQTLPWQARHWEFELATAAWRSELRAAGWLSEARTRTRTTAPGGRLPDVVRELALEELASHPWGADALYPTALLLTLWADAMAARATGDEEPAEKLATYVNDRYAAHDDPYVLDEDDQELEEDADEVPRRRPVDPRLRTLTDAITAWAAMPSTTEAAAVPSSEGGTRHVLSLLSQAIDDPGLPNWRYHGVIDAEGNHLVIVEYPGGKTTLLRDEEAGARGLFSWGYSGTGPHTFAHALAQHVASPFLRCADCLGTSPIVNRLITCASCSNSGQRPGRAALETLLVGRLISSLPNPGTDPALPSIVWTMTRTEVLRTIVGRGVPCRGPGPEATPDARGKNGTTLNEQTVAPITGQGPPCRRRWRLLRRRT